MNALPVLANLARMPYLKQRNIWANNVLANDATVVGMFGAFDIDSLHFETRLLIRKVRELTGESERDAVHRALAERYQRLTGPATLMERRHYLLDSLESVWRSVPAGRLGRGMSRAEEDEILGYGPEGV